MSWFARVQHALPHHALSRLAGRLAASEHPRLSQALIARFIRAYGVDMDEAERGAAEYRSFNDFFTRTLKPGARPIADPARHVVSPADGAVSQIGRIDHGRIVQAKGHDYTPSDLLGGDDTLADRFDGGAFATIYLSPRDYHRVHMPVAGTLTETRYVPGRLFSVNTVTAGAVPGLFARNERLVCLFDTALGTVASVMVGAMIVAGIETRWDGRIAGHGKRLVRSTHDGVALEAGKEMGSFLLGSTVVLLFEPDRVEWLEELKSGSVVRMGQAIGRRVGS